MHSQFNCRSAAEQLFIVMKDFFKSYAHLTADCRETIVPIVDGSIEPTAQYDCMHHHGTEFSGRSALVVISSTQVSFVKSLTGSASTRGLITEGL